MSHGAPRFRLVFGALLALALVPGCGVPTRSVAEPLASVPYELMSPSTAPSKARPSTQSEGRRLWWVRDGELVAVAGPPAGPDLEGTAAATLERLAAGPSEQERTAGLSTALGPDVRLALESLTNGRVVVDIRAGEQAPSAGRLPLAVGQLVLTLVSIDGVDQVLLTADRAAIEAPLPGGALTALPLRAEDYEALTASPP